MGAYLSLEVVRFGIEALFGNAIQEAIFPNNHGGCSLLPKVLLQLEELEFRKVADGQIFPGSVLSFDVQQRSNWMSGIFENRPIGEIIWPGTHHSATNQIGIRFLTRPYGERQTLSIYRQLRQGVRALDIRIQHDRFVCNGNISSVTTIDDVISDIKMFLEETQYEIIFLEIQTERGYADPTDFEAYLVNHLGDLLIHQDPKVFTQTIQQVLPRRIICVWKPNESPMPRYGGPIWASEYIEGDEVATQMPLDKFKGSINKLKDRAANSDMENFYKVEYTLTPQATCLMEWLLVWPRHAKVVSKRINDYARLFLAKCHAEGLLHRLQIISVDFVDEDFISACIALNNTLKPLQLQDLRTLLQNNGENFPGSATPVDQAQRYRWMEYFCLQQLPINKIVWPGTLNSGAYSIGVPFVTEAFVQCQSLSVYEQLRSGVRCLDIRIQKDHMICHAEVVANIGIDTVIGDIKRFLNETKHEIILLEVRTEYGQTDPPNFTQYLIDRLGGLLIRQDDRVFSKTIDQVLPGRIICVWKPRNSACPAPGSLLWKGTYLRDDWISTYNPLTKFNGNKSNLSNQVQVSERKYFYRVKHTMTAQTDNPLEFVIYWTKHVETLSRRLRPYARLFLAKCQQEGILDKLQIFSQDFIDGDFISACIQLSHTRIITHITMNVSDAANSFLFSARALSIAWGGDTKYWKWLSEGFGCEVAELLKVCWLEVNGKFDLARLRAGSTYEVIYVVMVRRSAHGLNHINLRLTLPNGEKKERVENFDDKPKDVWLTVSGGTFTASRGMAGEIKWSLDERVNGNWKSGLVVICVVFKGLS